MEEATGREEGEEDASAAERKATIEGWGNGCLACR